jgi:hypothetical protein
MHFETTIKANLSELQIKNIIETEFKKQFTRKTLKPYIKRLLNGNNTSKKQPIGIINFHKNKTN